MLSQCPAVTTDDTSFHSATRGFKRFHFSCLRLSQKLSDVFQKFSDFHDYHRFRKERLHELVPVETSQDVRVAITSFSSFSSCTARMTMGPRTAYSTRFTLGFMLSRVSTFPRLEPPFTACWDMFALSRASSEDWKTKQLEECSRVDMRDGWGLTDFTSCWRRTKRTTSGSA